MSQEMLKKMQDLLKQFYRIQSMNWIATKANGYGGAGQTLEILLKKAIDRDILPDYHGIEIKTKQLNSEPYIGLFSMALDNKPLRMKYIYDNFGWPSRNNPQYKVFYARINSHICRSTRKYSFQLYVNYEKEAVELKIYHNLTGELVNEELSWSFKHLELRLKSKLSYLAYVTVDRYYECESKTPYYKYQDIRFFQLRSFEQFLKLIEDGYVYVNIKLSYFKKGPREGGIDDKGTTFEIHQANLKKLFHEIDVQMDFS